MPNSQKSQQNFIWKNLTILNEGDVLHWWPRIRIEQATKSTDPLAIVKVLKACGWVGRDDIKFTQENVTSTQNTRVRLMRFNENYTIVLLLKWGYFLLEKDAEQYKGNFIKYGAINWN